MRGVHWVMHEEESVRGASRDARRGHGLAAVRHRMHAHDRWLALVRHGTHTAQLAERENGRDGGDEGTRTPDPRDANAVLSQLSYIPTATVTGDRDSDRHRLRHGPSRATEV